MAVKASPDDTNRDEQAVEPFNDHPSEEQSEEDLSDEESVD
jgi:hypothetical protein